MLIKQLPFFRSIYEKLNHQYERDIFVISELKKILPGAKILDAGCGDQKYRKYCCHLRYYGQDFGKYTVDDKKIIGSIGAGGSDGYIYGNLDYTCDICSIPEFDSTFDAILCTEVFEHIPYPINAVKEFSRLLKPGGILILTAPSNCFRHMDPFFFYSGFSDRWYQQILVDNKFDICKLEVVGDYFSWMAVEIARTMVSGSLITKLFLFPAFVYYFSRKSTPESKNTLSKGYHVVAIKKY